MKLYWILINKLLNIYKNLIYKSIVHIFHQYILIPNYNNLIYFLCLNICCVSLFRFTLFLSLDNFNLFLFCKYNS